MDIPAVSMRVFSGGAGFGKTFHVMQALEEYLQVNPLKDGQKVLALTYMHGSRRRLHGRLEENKGLAGRFECVVLDGLAGRVVLRWQALLLKMGRSVPAVGDFNNMCEAAALLLRDEVVCRWMAATYPVLILDEAQDLDISRLAIIQALSVYINVIAAADEFQCLDDKLRPNKAFEWLESATEVEWLTKLQRTKSGELLGAAAAIRNGVAPVSGKEFRILLAPRTRTAGSFLANQLAWYGRAKTTAIITTAVRGFATSVCTWVAENKADKTGTGPFFIPWEVSESKAAEVYLGALKLPAAAGAQAFIEYIKAAGDDRTLKDVCDWFDIQRRALGVTEFQKDVVIEVIERSFSSRRHASPKGRSRVALTVHGAKNREFDNVVVLWSAATVGDADHQRRLLYNAVTRARERCLVLVHLPQAMRSPPFA
ncbi:ATP-binding domain-containing protein [Herbaspirillum sp. DW155]|uniref:ATP-dependent helicase n=1 Tax=Herbaspirillum sp. DW155 TaxID=3095609 RepID=UPI0030936B9B|nr:ATP-binding domain-containing protein [Herbaspirillum sp. DW155]